MNRFSMITIAFTLTLAACPMKKDTSTPTGGAGTPPAATGGMKMAGTMAEAPTQAYPSTVELKPACHQDNYLVLAVPAGKEFEVEITSVGGCTHLNVMKENGSTNDMPNAEVCADAPKTLKSVGQPGKTFIAINETGVCAGATTTLSFK
ncbi:MAG: hypothetical protein NT062_20740 [Proteobacteria bacterium]|nr:hypothetical protein [Pseudomonadota bacterium]